MHQNRFRLGLRPRPRWGSLRRSPRPPSRLGGDRRLGRVHSRAFGTPLNLPYHLYVCGAASVCVYCVNCTKFGQLILRIIIKIDATRCQIFRPKCTKIVFGSGGAYSGRAGEGKGGRGRDGKGGHPEYFIAPPVPVF